MPQRSLTNRRRQLLQRPVVIAVAVAVAMTGAGTAAANDWLHVFESAQIDPVAFSTSDLMALPDLSAYGDVAVTGDDGVHGVPDAKSASAATGLHVPIVPELPRGVSGQPHYEVGGPVEVTFTFSAEQANESASAAGQVLPPPPAGLDGSQVHLEAGPGVAAIWVQASGVPGLVVARTVAPKAYSSGVEFEVMRDYLLALPGIPHDVATQLGTFRADGSTLPLPIPTDRITTSAADVNGVPATLLATDDRTFAAVIWVTDGIVTGVAGPLDSDEVLSVGRALR